MPVQYSYTSTPPMGRTACTEPHCLYSIAIPLLPLWAVRPVQILSACTRVHFTFYPLFEDLWTFMIAPRRIILGMRNISDERFRARQNTHFVLLDIFLQIVTFVRIMGTKYCIAGEAYLLTPWCRVLLEKLTDL